MPYSNRLAWSAPTNSYSLLLEKERSTGKTLLDLTAANPTVLLPEYPHADIAQALASVRHFGYQPQALGLARARSQVACWYAAHGIPAQVERIALTASSSEAYSLLFKLLCDPGDEVLVQAPSYPLFEYLAKAESVNPAAYPLQYDGKWFLDIGRLEPLVSARTKAVVIVNPNNPTGSFLKSGELAALTRFCLRHRLAVISDEVFQTYGGASPDCVRSLIGHHELLSFSINGLSKAAGMPQMKLGWIVVNGPAAQARQAVSHLELLLDSYLSVGMPVQEALGPLLEIGSRIHRMIERRVRKNRAAVVELLAASAVQPLDMEGGWAAILRLPRLLSEEQWISRLLQRHAVIVQPGYFYDMAAEAYIVVSLIAAEDDLRNALAHLREMVRYSKAGLSPDHERS